MWHMSHARYIYFSLVTAVWIQRNHYIYTSFDSTIMFLDYVAKLVLSVLANIFLLLLVVK